MSKDPDHIYILECACGCCTHAKVGICTSPAKRLGQLQCGSPTRLKYLYVAKVKGLSARTFEKRVHEKLAILGYRRSNLPREWFALSGADANTELKRLGKSAKVSLQPIDLSVFEFPLPDALRAEREKLGWTIRKLASLSGVGDATISDYENGQTLSPRSDTRERIRRAFRNAGVLLTG